MLRRQRHRYRHRYLFSMNIVHLKGEIRPMLQNGFESRKDWILKAYACASTGARPIMRNPENKRLLTPSGYRFTLTSSDDDYRGVNDINASYHIFVLFLLSDGRL
jgi:hypothetical protein